MLAVNQLLQNRYRIIRQLGRGGMGAVYEAVDERFGEPIALKEILIESVDEKQKNLIVNAFEREAKSLAKARHEAVPYVRDYFSEINRQFLVMELVEGDDLGRMLENRKSPFLLQDTINWANQLLDALDYLHNLKPPIIHRDIKPQNLKLSSRRKIKLLDFGIAKSGDKTSTINNQTFVGATLDYSPIEQILRVIDATFREFIILKHKEKAENILQQYTDVRCDIYAFGATFYHLLTNRLPENATKRTLAIWEGKEDPLPYPSKLNPEIPPSISDCLLKAMQIERDHRFSSATDMQAALQQALEEEKTRKMEKTLPLIEPEYLRNVEKEEIVQQNSTQAVTEKLIPENEIKDKIEDKVILSASAAPTESFNILPSDTQTFSDSEFARFQKAKSNEPENISKANFTENVYSAEILSDQKKVVYEPFSFLGKETKESSNGNAKMFWLLPIAALSILTVSGISGIMWLNNSDSTTSNKRAEKAVVSTPTPTAEASPTVAPSASATPNNINKSDERAKPSVLSVPNKTPFKNKEKPPAPARIKTPIPEKIIDDDCRYNGKCN